MREPEHFRQIARRKEHRRALRGELLDETVDLLARSDVDPARRLVEEEHARRILEPFAEDDLLLVAAGERSDFGRGRAADLELVDPLLGDQLLGVLVALPDVEVPAGTRPTFTDAQVVAAVQQAGGEARGLRGKVLLKARVALVQLALSSLPPRADPDALVVPDHL
jgi:hypothetical protein